MSQGVCSGGDAVQRVADGADYRPGTRPDSPPPNYIPGEHGEVRQVSEAEQLAFELMAEHPQPGLPLKAAAEIDKVLRRDPSAANVMREHHPAWCEYWATLPVEKYVPQLWRWIAEGEWRIEPVVRKPMSKADAKMEEVLRLYADRSCNRIRAS